MQTVCFPFAADIPVGGGHPSAMLLMQSLDAGGVRPVVALHGPDGPAGRWLAEHGANFRQVHFDGYAGGTPRNPFRDIAFIVRHSRRLAQFLKEERVAIVRANDIWMMAPGHWRASWRRSSWSGTTARTPAFRSPTGWRSGRPTD